MDSGRVTVKQLLTRLWRDKSGASAVELALLSALILVPLSLGSLEIGRRIWIRSQLDNAVRVGVEYVMIKGASNVANIQTAVQSATSLGTEVTISPAYGSSYSYCGCASSSGVTPQTCGSACSTSGDKAGTYAGITASVSYTPLFHDCGSLLPASVCPLSSGATSWSSRAVARIQ
jgi:Flp pilus assembly protein TadG